MEIFMSLFPIIKNSLNEDILSNISYVLNQSKYMKLKFGNL